MKDDRETADGYTLETAYWAGNLYDAEAEFDVQKQLEADAELWRKDGDIMEDDFDTIFGDLTLL